MFHKVSHGHILVCIALSDSVPHRLNCSLPLTFVFGKGYRIIGACLFDDSMAEEMMQVVRIS
jgi:hypothetical protein